MIRVSGAGLKMRAARVEAKGIIFRQIVPDGEE
jgi:hypothetical protein